MLVYRLCLLSQYVHASIKICQADFDLIAVADKVGHKC